MHPLTILRPVALVSLSCAVVACGDGGGPTAPPEVTPVATALRLPTGTVGLQVPQTTTVTAEVRDQLDRVMPSLTPTWTSRDSTTAKVTPTGVVTAVETGDAWVVATAAGLSDSVMVRVRFPLGEGEARMRIRGTDQDRTRLLEGLGWSWDLVGTDTLDRIQLEFAGTDALLMFVAPSPLLEGDLTVQAWSTQEILGGATIFQVPTPGALFLATGDDGTTIYVGDSGYLEVTHVRAAASGGRGSLRGHLRLRAPGYDLTTNNPASPSASPTGDTVTCDLDFDVSFVHRETGYAIVDLKGGPTPTEGEMWEASVEWPNVNPPETPLIQLRVGSWAELTAMIHSPRPDTLSVYRQDPNGSFGAGDGRTSLRMTGYYPYFRASGQGGTVTLQKVVWPEAGSSGELSGTMDASLLYWLQNNPQNAQTGTVSMEFHALWPPKGAAPAAPAPADTRSPWSPLLRLPGDAGPNGQP